MGAQGTQRQTGFFRRVDMMADWCERLDDDVARERAEREWLLYWRLVILGE